MLCRAREERGFSFFELLTAMFVLLVGVLGTVSLIDGANATTAITKAREGGTNLARELVETSRSIDYDKVTQADLAGELQTKPGLADTSGNSGWQVVRRGVTYTITPTVCTFDDGTDGAGVQNASFCSGSVAAGTADSNPDDYRRVTFLITWSNGGPRKKASQTGILSNPSGGLGPRITCFDTPNCTSPNNLITSSGTTSVPFTVTTTNADAVRWSVDDNGVNGDASGGPTNWTFSWSIGTVGTFSCGTTPTWTLDGDYLANAQGFDARGIPGDLRTRTVTLDRSAPAPPCGLTGGRNGSIVDLQWLKNPERDITGYRVFRVKIGAEPADVQVCGPITTTSCYDNNPPSAGQADPIRYYVRAYDSSRNTASATLSVPQTGNTAPDPPGTLVATVADGQPVLTWTAASDPDGTIQFYRIYRDNGSGFALADRYDATGNASLSYTDTRATSTNYRYWVTAVDNKFTESAPVGPVEP